MLTQFDDYPIHQTPEPIAHKVSSERNLYDRYWYNGYDRDGEFYIGIATALYPNLGILDCGFSIVRDGEQHAFHASRRAPAEPSETPGGARSGIEILEPMKSSNRVVIDPNETGIDCDLTFVPRTACVEEGLPEASRAPGGRVIMDVHALRAVRPPGRGWVKLRRARSSKIDPVPRVRHQGPLLGPSVPMGDPAPLRRAAYRGRAAGLLRCGRRCTGRTSCSYFGVFEDENGLHAWHARTALIVPAYDLARRHSRRRPTPARAADGRAASTSIQAT